MHVEPRLIAVAPIEKITESMPEEISDQFKRKKSVNFASPENEAENSE